MSSTVIAKETKLNEVAPAQDAPHRSVPSADHGPLQDLVQVFLTTQDLAQSSTQDCVQFTFVELKDLSLMGEADRSTTTTGHKQREPGKWRRGINSKQKHGRLPGGGAP